MTNLLSRAYKLEERPQELCQAVTMTPCEGWVFLHDDKGIIYHLPTVQTTRDMQKRLADQSQHIHKLSTKVREQEKLIDIWVQGEYA